jgi:hypothetical protein
MAAIVYQTDKRSGITYTYESVWCTSPFLRPVAGAIFAANSDGSTPASARSINELK